MISNISATNTAGDSTNGTDRVQVLPATTWPKRQLNFINRGDGSGDGLITLEGCESLFFLPSGSNGSRIIRGIQHYGAVYLQRLGAANLSNVYVEAFGLEVPNQ
jgi:hypothetical protein